MGRHPAVLKDFENIVPDELDFFEKSEAVETTTLLFTLIAQS